MSGDSSVINEPRPIYRSTFRDNYPAPMQPISERDRLIRNVAQYILLTAIVSLAAFSYIWNFTLTPYLIGAGFGILLIKILQDGFHVDPRLSLSIPLGFASIRTYLS